MVTTALPLISDVDEPQLSAFIYRCRQFSYNKPTCNKPFTFSRCLRFFWQDAIDQKLVDATEQILIHLFGRQFLLNSQPGGFYRAYLPQQEDLTISGLTSDQVLRGLFIGQHQQGHVDQEIQQQCQAWYQDHLQDVDPQRAAQLDGALIDLFAQQASSGATTATGLTPLMIFAKGITREDAALLRGFFDGSRAGLL